MAQSIDPNQVARGELSLRLRLAGRGRSDERLPSLNGKLGLIVFPSSSQGLKTLDLWGGGLLRNLGSTFEPGRDKNVNCGVATFDIGRGQLESQALMLDTERIRVAGRLNVDLAQGTLDGLLMPKSKRAELFSSQLPISIGGTLSGPSIAPAAGGLLLASARYFLFAYIYLYDTATGGALPADGRADCIAIYDRLVAPR